MCLTETQTDNSANVYGGARTHKSVDRVINHYIGAGATARKLNLGKFESLISVTCTGICYRNSALRKGL